MKKNTRQKEQSIIMLRAQGAPVRKGTRSLEGVSTQCVLLYRNQKTSHTYAFKEIGGGGMVLISNLPVGFVKSRGSAGIDSMTAQELDFTRARPALKRDNLCQNQHFSQGLA